MNTRQDKTGNKRVRGMTLIEVLIVLGMMAAMAGIMIKGVASTDNRVRSDRTRTLLRQVRLASIGDGIETSRFIQDMGRLPVVTSIDEGKILSELWKCPDPYNDGKMEEVKRNPNSWAPSVDSSIYASLPDISINVGWNGPYLLVNNPDDNSSYDGFGNCWQISSQDTPLQTENTHWNDNDLATASFSVPSFGDSIKHIRSLGRDRATGGDKSENTDQYMNLQGQMAKTELVIRIKAQNASGSPSVWTSVEERNDTFVNASTVTNKWEKDKTIIPDDLPYRINENGSIFECTIAGATGSTKPGLQQIIQGGTVTDGSVTWTCVWKKRENYQLNRLRAAVFYPVVSVNPAGRSVGVADYVSEDDGGFKSEITISSSSLTPGLRKLFVYGYYEGDAGSPVGSGVQNIILKPGKNYITVYLAKEKIDG